MCVTGNIGSGKTTVANIIESVFNFKKFEEAAEKNPFLHLFYEDKKKWAYKTQIYYLMTRFTAHEEIMMHPDSAVQDRSIYEDMEIFTRLQIKLGNFTQEEAERYRMFCRLLHREMKPPDLLIYLRASIPVLRGRITNRGRNFEKELMDPADTYLVELQNLYESWVRNYSLGPRLIVETDSLNFVDNPKDIQTLVTAIKSIQMRKEPKLYNFLK